RAASEHPARDLRDALPGDDPRRRRPDRRRAGALCERRARLLAADRGREGASRRPPPRGRAARPGRERVADAGRRPVIVDSLTFADEGLIDALDAAGIDRAVVVAPRARGHGYDVANDRVSSLVADHPGRLVGFARADPLTPGA